MRMIVYEGTPEEIREVQKGFISQEGSRIISITSEHEASSDDSDSEGHTWASVEVAHLALTRRKLSRAQRSVIIAIYRGHPDWVLATELQQQISYTASQFAGLMGAFGRRFTHTDGYVYGMWFFDQEWDYENGCVRYRLPDSVREAIEKAKLV